MKNFFFLSVFLCSFVTLNAQDHSHYCLYDHVIQAKSNVNPAYAEAIKMIRAQCEDEFRNHERAADTYFIPVVFHVIYNNESQNIPDEVIFDQLQILNEDYSRNNPNADETRDVFVPLAADTQIQFYLAGEDPEGNTSIGINRVETDRSGFAIDLFDPSSFDEMKHEETGGANAWDTDHYVNIWICNIEPTWLGQIFGLAYPPEDAPNWPAGSSASSPENEGVIVHYTVVGSNNPSAGDDGFEGNEGGRTLTHEMGHYLGLRHIWGDATFFDDGCDVDDGIEDTPTVELSANFLCDYDGLSCDGIGASMIENFMDYNTDACYNMFTEEQAAMMRYVIDEFRFELLEGDIAVHLSENILPELNISPNPVRETLHISAVDSKSLSGEIRVLDLSGKCVETYEYNGLETWINVSTLPNGIYFLEFPSASGIVRSRFVKI